MKRGPARLGRFAIFASIAGCVACIVVGACGGSGSSAGNGGAASDGGSAGDFWTIGVSNSLTGGLAGNAGGLQNGWTVAEYLVNSSGGILGKSLRFIQLDDQSDDDTQADDGAVVTRVANQLVADDVVGVIGPNGSAQVLTVQNLLYGDHVLEIAANATSVDLTDAQPPMSPGVGPDGGRYLFRTAPPDSFQGGALAELSNLGIPGIVAITDGGAALPNTCDAGGGGAGATAPGCSALAILYYSNAYGTPMEAVAAQKYRGTVVATVPIDSTVKSDYSAEISAITSANPDCLAMIVYYDVADAFLIQLASTLNGPFPFMVMGTDGVYNQSFITNGRTNPSDPTSSVAEGAYGTTPDTEPAGSPDYSYFASQYALLFPSPTGETGIPVFASNEFDAAMLIALALAQAGGATNTVESRGLLRDALYSVANGTGASHGASDWLGALRDIQAGRPVSYSGASGPCVMNATGDVKAGYLFWQVQNGQFVTLRHVTLCELPQ